MQEDFDFINSNGMDSRGNWKITAVFNDKIKLNFKVKIELYHRYYKEQHVDMLRHMYEHPDKIDYPRDEWADFSCLSNYIMIDEVFEKKPIVTMGTKIVCCLRSVLPWDDYISYRFVCGRLGKGVDWLDSFDIKNNMFVMFMCDQKNDKKCNLVICQTIPYQILKIVKQYDIEEIKTFKDVSLRDLVLMIKHDNGRVTKFFPYIPPYFELQLEKITRR
jgi:hypothetical protein